MRANVFKREGGGRERVICRPYYKGGGGRSFNFLCSLSFVSAEVEFMKRKTEERGGGVEKKWVGKERGEKGRAAAAS